MKKQIALIWAGLTLLLVLTVVVGAQTKGGKVAYNQVNLSVFSNPKIMAGEDVRTVNGSQIPGTITYTDEMGVDTTYVSVRKMAELLDAVLIWDSETKTADFAGRDDGGLSSITVSVGSKDEGLEEMPHTPQLGVQKGPFTEIAPTGNKRGGRTLLDHADFKSRTGFANQLYYFYPELGNYIEIEVTNHGAPVRFRVDRPILLGGIYAEQFSTVYLDTEETLTRAFRIADTDVELQRLLSFTVEALSVKNEADITVHIAQYSQWSET